MSWQKFEQSFSSLYCEKFLFAKSMIAKHWKERWNKFGTILGGYLNLWHVTAAIGCEGMFGSENSDIQKAKEKGFLSKEKEAAQVILPQNSYKTKQLVI